MAASRACECVTSGLPSAVRRSFDAASTLSIPARDCASPWIARSRWSADSASPLASASRHNPMAR